MYSPGESQCAEKERKMAHPAFKNCLAMHTGVGIATSYADGGSLACKGLPESYVDNATMHTHKSLAES